LVSPLVYVALTAAIFTSFLSSLIEATYLTLRPLSLTSEIGAGSHRAAEALKIVNQKTSLVAVTTFIDTISNVVLASSIGLILSDAFGPIGWVYSAIGGSLAIMVLLYLLPKAIGIENALRMSIFLAPATVVLMDALAPVAVPMTSVARSLSERIVGKPGYTEVDLVDEFEDVVTMLEKAGHIEPDAGRLLRTALASSRNTASDVLTPMSEIVHIESDATNFDALKAMGKTAHPRIPVYDSKKRLYIGAVTFRTLSKAIGHDQLNAPVVDYMIQPARVSKDDGIATVMEHMQDSASTIAFVFDGTAMVGMITFSDIIERVLGVKV
jgi:magnesium and cobalt exporter, CNNM family